MTTGFRRYAAMLALALSMMQTALAAQDPAARQAEFDAAVDRLRRADPTVDFTRLRTLSTELPGYEPYAEGDNNKDMNAAMGRSDFKEALRLARVDLDADYLDIDAHIVAMIASDKTGDTKSFEHHRWVVKSIYDSITGSGDGKTSATAYRVVTVREEYAALMILGLRRSKQALVHDGPHSFDVLTAVDPETKAETTIYFNIDPIIAHQTKLFSKEKPAGGVIGGVPGGAPSPNADGSPRKVTDGVLAGKALSRPQPEYPKMARAAGVDGEVVVEVIVSETGVIESARVISGHPLLRDNALAAAKKWVFEPTILDGVPVKVVGTITFNFRKG